MRRHFIILLICWAFCISASAQYPGPYKYPAKTATDTRQSQRKHDSLLKVIAYNYVNYGNRIQVVGERYVYPLHLWSVGVLTSFDADHFDEFYRWRQFGTAGIAIPAIVKNIFPGFNPYKEKLRENILLAVKFDPLQTKVVPSAIKTIGRAYPAYLLPEGLPIRVFALGINSKNVDDYQYHVVLDDTTEIVPWTTAKLEKQYSAAEPYGLIGDFVYPDKQMLIEVVNRKNYADRAGLLIDWRKRHDPVLRDFSGRAYGSVFTLTNTSRGYAKTIDPYTRLPKDLNFPATSIDLMMFDFQDHETVPYYLTIFADSAGKRFLKYRTNINTNHFELQTPLFNTLGKYDIVISISKFTIDKGEGALHIPFTVRKLAVDAEPSILSSDSIGDWATGLLAITAAAFGGYYAYNRRKLTKSEREKSMAAVQLKSVRAQLNPHFMFNALTSIQNLMNQQDTEGANHYLSKFAVLTRRILKTSNKELISVHEELQLITDYLEMEQLRFGFKFVIEVDPKINRANTDIPAMLIQPFVENAAKHAMSSRLDQGIIDIIFTRNNRDIMITIQDNGPGFSTIRFGGEGHGLALTKERIKLLNQLYPDQRISLDIISNVPGTKIVVMLTDWI